MVNKKRLLGLLILALLLLGLWWFLQKDNISYSISLIDLMSLFTDLLIGIFLVLLIFNISEKNNEKRQMLTIADDILQNIIERLYGDILRIKGYTNTKVKNQNLLSEQRRIKNDIEIILTKFKSSKFISKITLIKTSFQDYWTFVSEDIHTSSNYTEISKNACDKLDSIISNIQSLRLDFYD